MSDRSGRRTPPGVRTVIVLVAAILACAVLLRPWGRGGSTEASIYPGILEPPPSTGPSSAVLSAGKFLVARGSMRDPNFEKTVVYLVRYDLEGALGVVLNRPTRVRLSEALPHLKWLEGSPIRLLWGGPVEGTRLTILALSRAPVPGAVHVHGDLYAGWDIEIFREFFEGGSGEIRAVRAYGGYAGWAPGQLAAEVERGGWRVMDADESEIFRDTSRLWYRLTGRR